MSIVIRLPVKNFISQRSAEIQCGLIATKICDASFFWLVFHWRMEEKGAFGSKAHGGDPWKWGAGLEVCYSCSKRNIIKGDRLDHIIVFCPIISHAYPMYQTVL